MTEKLQFVEQFAHTMRYGAQILGIAFMVMSKWKHLVVVHHGMVCG